MNLKVHILKKFNRFNFYRFTYCEFVETDIEIIKNWTADFESPCNSTYYYTNEGVYRLADHWGRVANCRWKLRMKKGGKNQKFHLGFANWGCFLPINDHDRLYYIAVDVDSGKVNFSHYGAEREDDLYLFTAADARKRVRQIRNLYETDKWARYYNMDLDILRKQLVRELISSDKSLALIKRSLVS